MKTALILTTLLFSFSAYSQCETVAFANIGVRKQFCETFSAQGIARGVGYVKGGKAVAIEDALNNALAACESSGLQMQRLSAWKFQLSGHVMHASAQFTCTAQPTRNAWKDICPYDDFKSSNSYCYR